MLDASNKTLSCTTCREAIEELLHEGTVTVQPNSDLAAHLGSCAECREVLEISELSSRLMSSMRETVPAATEPFVTRAMALAREAAERDSTANAIWRPLELLASRFAFVAAAVLLALSLYLAESAPARLAMFRSNQTEIGAGMPEPPAAPPSNEDDVLMSIAEMPNGN